MVAFSASPAQEAKVMIIVTTTAQLFIMFLLPNLLLTPFHVGEYKFGWGVFRRENQKSNVYVLYPVRPGVTFAMTVSETATACHLPKILGVATADDHS